MRGLRSLVAGILVVLACVLAPVSVASVWANEEISDTDAYLETVAPLATDQELLAAVADKVTAVIFRNVNVDSLGSDLVETVAPGKVPDDLGDDLSSLDRSIRTKLRRVARKQVAKVLNSSQFATAWDQVNRVAHDQVVAVLEGKQGGALSAKNETITLNLGPIVEAVRKQLVDRGFAVASDIPSVETAFVLVDSPAVARAQDGSQVLNLLGVWLPFVALGLFVAGVLVASDRRRALLFGSLGVVAAMILLGIGLALLRAAYLDAVPPTVLPSEAAASVFDTLIRSLRSSLQWVALAGLVVALGAFLFGPSPPVVRLRSALRR